MKTKTLKLVNQVEAKNVPPLLFHSTMSPISPFIV